MTEDIFTYLNNLLIDTENINLPLNNGVNFLTVFFNNNKDANLIFKNNSLKDIITIYLITLKPEKYADIINYLDTLPAMFTEDNYDHLEQLLNFVSDERLGVLYEKGRMPKSIKDSLLKSKMKRENGVLNNKEILSSVDDFDNFLAFFSKLPFTKAEANELIAIINIYRNYDSHTPVSQTDLYLAMSSFKKRYTQQKKHCLSIIREWSRSNNKIQKVIDILKENPTYVEPKVVEELMNIAIEDDIKHHILNYIVMLNSKLENDIRKSYYETKNNSEDAVITLLKHYNIPYEMLTEEEIKELAKKNYNELQEMLEYFNSHQIPLTNPMNLLKYNLNSLRNIISLLENNVLTKEFVLNNLYLIENDNPLYITLVKNLDNLAIINVNIKNYPHNLNILLNDLSNSLNILNNYGLVINNKTTDISFLNDKLLSNKLDLLLEFGQNLNDLNSLDTLNLSFENIYLYLLSVKLEINYSEELFAHFNPEDLMPNPSLIIPENIQNLLASNNSYLSSLPEYLAPYAVNNTTLVIKGIPISLNRVLKNLSVININNYDEVLYALIYNSYYNIDQVNILSDSLKQIMGKSR